MTSQYQIARQQIHEKKPENYGFASFESVPFAHIVAKTLHGKRRLGSHFELAPQVCLLLFILISRNSTCKLTYRTTQPIDIIWPNLTMSDGARTKNKFFGGILLILLCGFYTIPLIAVALLANLAALYFYRYRFSR